MYFHIYHLPQHPLEHLVEPCDEAVRPRVVDRGPQVSHLQKPTQSSISLDIKGTPWSVRRSLGTSTRLNSSMSSLPMFQKMAVHRGTTSGYLVVYTRITRMYSLPGTDFGSGPTGPCLSTERGQR